METNKFEEHIREKLQEREIKPSQNAWSLLEKKLDEQITAKKAFPIWWAIAASFVGVLLISVFFFNNSNKTNNKLVDIEQNSKPKTTPNNKPEIKNVLTTNNTTNPIVKVTQKPIEKQKDNKTTITSSVIAKSNKTQPVYKPKINSIKQEIVTDFETQKVTEIVQTINNLQKENKKISLDEIDALLAKAQKDIAYQKWTTKKSQKVDAAALLDEVEYEIDRSFRDKVFNALGSGFQKVRTAMLERNQ